MPCRKLIVLPGRRISAFCLTLTLVVGFFGLISQAKAVLLNPGQAESVGPLLLAKTETPFSPFPPFHEWLHQAKPATPLFRAAKTLLPAGKQGGESGEDDEPSIPKTLREPGRVVRGPSSVVRGFGSLGSEMIQEPVLELVLGQVSHRLWLPTADGLPDSAPSARQARLPTQFHGVGFPDIRTHRIVGPYDSFDPDQPHNWNSMVVWRPADEGGQAREPIAEVHCMGLSPQAVARRADRYEQLILDSAREFEVNGNLVKAMVTKESCFDSEALSRAGAQGLMQLMPDTAQWLKVDDPLDPEENLRAGVRYIASLKKQFGDLDLALAAYNAGPGNVRRYEGVPPFAETKGYVQMVKAYYRRYKAASKLAVR